MAAGCRRASAGSPPRRADHQLHAEEQAQHHATPARARDRQGSRERAGHPLLVPRRKRPACDPAGGDRHRQQYCRQRRQRTGEPDEAHSADCRRDLGNRRSTGPSCASSPRADLAARLGVSTESLSQTIRVATIGDVGPALAKFDAGDRQVPIRVQLEDSARGDLQTLQQLRVPLGEHGEKGGVPLSVVADIKLDQGPTSINRYDRERQATVAADLVGTAALGDVTKRINELPVMKSLPKSVKVGPSGDAEALKESVGRLCHRDDRRPDDGLCGAGAVVRHLPAADHHPVLAAALDRRRHRCAAADRQAAHGSGLDRHADVDGHRHQERHHAGGIRRRNRSAKASRATRRSSTRAASARVPS